MISTAFVKIWDTRVGAIAWDSSTGLGSFEFENSFLEKNWDLSPLKMPISEARGRIFSFHDAIRSNTFKGLPGLIADSLPDYFGKIIINASINQKLNPVEILCLIGKQGMGALEFEPNNYRGSNTASHIEIENLVKISNDVLTGSTISSFDNLLDKKVALSDIFAIGRSAKGSRAKALIAFNTRTKEIRSGHANVPKGFSHWIIKFDGISNNKKEITKGFCNVEMAYHLMAIDAGIEMAPCRLFEENDRTHFMTRRFDRGQNNSKYHIQSFCALRHFDFNEIYSYSYEQLFETMRLLGLPYPQSVQLFRRMVFNVIANNRDDHAKNFEFIMGKNGEWKLAPAFDLCFSYNPESISDSQHSLSVNGKRRNITKSDILTVAKQMNIKKATDIFREIYNIVCKWPQYAIEANVSPELTKAIKRNLFHI